MTNLTKPTDNYLEASFEVFHFTIKDKCHKSLVLPVIVKKKKKVEIIVKQKPNKLRDIPLSAHFLGSHIENISEDIRKIWG